MKISTTMSKTLFVLKGVTDKNAASEVVKTPGVITENIAKKEAYLYIGKKLETKAVKSALNKVISNANRDYQLDVKSLVSNDSSEEEIIYATVIQNELIKGEIYSAKSKKEKPKKLDLLNVSAEGKKVFKVAKVQAESQTFARDLQVSPPNIMHSEEMAIRVKDFLSKNKNLTVKVLTKKQIQTLGMGLLLGVNKGSHYEPRVVVVEYKGDAKSKDKTAIIGKGVTFDTGGLNIKTGKSMLGMKFDMSGAAVVAGAMNVIASQKPKANVSAVLCITDNPITSDARYPDSVDISMSGKTVEINNTDAEGRLAMADGLTYAVRKLKATRLVDISTLTGAVIGALGSTYSGIWTTEESDWTKINEAAITTKELVWRLPFHQDYRKFIESTKIADLYNTDLSGKAGSSSAAEFLKSFSEGKPYIHIDIAGTADVDGVAKAPMVRTLAEFVAK